MNLEEYPESRTPVSGQHAQVDPAELTNAFLDAAKERGAKLGIGSVEGLNTEDGRVISVCLESGINVPVKDDLVVAMGPWSCRVEDWLDIPVPVDGVLSTSLVWDNLEHDLEAAALFCEDDSNGCNLEVIPRLNKSLFLSGCGESQTMSPATLRGPHRPKPGEELPSQSRAMAAQKSIRTLNFVANLPPDDIRACIRPAAPDGMPIVGKVLENVYVATGGGPWGITWGPLMGLMVASMIQGDDLPMRAATVNPGRFDTMIYRTLLEQRGKEAWSADKEP
jgi:glycine/D-amino acid oxidase-like deaminating enzyme